jgi:hypothetical protein
LQRIKDPSPERAQYLSYGHSHKKIEGIAPITFKAKWYL